MPQNAADSARAKVDSAVKALAATQAQLAVIDAQIDGVRVQIDKTEVRAPADGLVLARAATVGGIVSPTSGPLFRIAIDAEFELEANVAETALPRLAAGMKGAVVLPGIEERIEGSIRRIAPEVDQKSRLGLIRIALPKDAPARAGSFARARDRNRPARGHLRADLGGALPRGEAAAPGGRGRPHQHDAGYARRRGHREVSRLCRASVRATRWLRAPAPLSPTATW